MFREILDTIQKRDEPRRRWFSSLSMDLFVWLDDDDEITRYQLTYNKPHDEKALVWDREKGFAHLGVDDGVRPGKHPGSPLLIKDGIFIPSKVVAMIRNDEGDLAPWIKNFIVAGIEAHFDPG